MHQCSYITCRRHNTRFHLYGCIRCSQCDVLNSSYTVNGICYNLILNCRNSILWHIRIAYHYCNIYPQNDCILCILCSSRCIHYIGDGIGRICNVSHQMCNNILSHIYIPHSLLNTQLSYICISDSLNYYQHICHTMDRISHMSWYRCYRNTHHYNRIAYRYPSSLFDLNGNIRCSFLACPSNHCREDGITHTHSNNTHSLHHIGSIRLFLSIHLYYANMRCNQLLLYYILHIS